MTNYLKQNSIKISWLNLKQDYKKIRFYMNYQVKKNIYAIKIIFKNFVLKIKNFVSIYFNNHYTRSPTKSSPQFLKTDSLKRFKCQFQTPKHLS